MEFGGVFHLVLESVPNKNEDAISFLFDQEGNGRMFVFDGCGGAGALLHESLNGEKSAYISARSAALLIDKLYPSPEFGGMVDSEELAKKLYRHLCELNEAYPMESFQPNTMYDVLPTAVTGAFIRSGKDEVQVQFLWAGDTRGFILDHDGLAQVTEDDVSARDAYHNISADGIHTNRVHGNQNKPPFVLHSTELTLKDKCVVICATDGCYDYFDSPMTFEFFLLAMMNLSKSFEEMRERLVKFLKRLSGDDCALAAAFYGFEDYADFKEFISDRFAFLHKDKEHFDQAYWEDKYKTHYYRLDPVRNNTDE